MINKSYSFMYDVLRTLLETLVSLKPLWVSQEHRELLGAECFLLNVAELMGYEVLWGKRKRDPKEWFKNIPFISVHRWQNQPKPGGVPLFMVLEGSVLHEENMTEQLSSHQEWRVKKQKRKCQPSAHFPLFKFCSTWAPSSQTVFALQLMSSGDALMSTPRSRGF